MKNETLRETAERIIEGIPISYRDGDEEAGRERTIKWLEGVLEEFVENGNFEWLRGCYDRLKASHDNMRKALKELSAFSYDPARHIALEALARSESLISTHYESDTKRLDWRRTSEQQPYADDGFGEHRLVLVRTFDGEIKLIPIVTPDHQLAYAEYWMPIPPLRIDAPR